tara:strand:- start:116 stop:334 length:219 start_codon:yes stop_codon:yes gene_type:complete
MTESKSQTKRKKAKEVKTTLRPKTKETIKKPVDELFVLKQQVGMLRERFTALETLVRDTRGLLKKAWGTLKI